MFICYPIQDFTAAAKNRMFNADNSEQEGQSHSHRRYLSVSMPLYFAAIEENLKVPHTTFSFSVHITNSLKEVKLYIVT